jgi:hypothetical protein
MLRNRRPGARQTICQSSTDTVHNFSTGRFFEGLNKIIISTVSNLIVAHEFMIMKSTHNNNSAVTLYKAWLVRCSCCQLVESLLHKNKPHLH